MAKPNNIDMCMHRRSYAELLLAAAMAARSCTQLLNKSRHRTSVSEGKHASLLAIESLVRSETDLAGAPCSTRHSCDGQAALVRPRLRLGR